MADEKNAGSSEGADDIELLRRMRFPDLAREYVIELKAWAQLHGFDIHANHVWGRLESDGNGGMRLAPMVQIHGLCARATATGEFGGVDEPVATFNPDGTLLKVSVTAYRLVDGVRCPFVGTAYWREYYPGPGFWDAKPIFMLGKCALAIALRWAFAVELGGCYLPEELELGRMFTMAANTSNPGGAEADDDDDLPNTPMQLQLRLVDWGLSDPAHREKVIAGFRVKLAHLLEQPQFYAEVFKAVRANPTLYGAVRPEAA